MAKLDFNRTLIVLVPVALIAIAAFTNNRIEIGPKGIKMERNHEQHYLPVEAPELGDSSLQN